jgi:predicted Fe-Mo cluster-binding NifX family protein
MVKNQWPFLKHEYRPIAHSLGKQEVGLKIGIAAEGQDLEAKVSHRLGTSQYLIVIDLATMEVEAMPNPSPLNQRGAGMQLVALAISKKVNKVFTGYCSPTAEGYLSARGIDVLTGVVGTVAEVLGQVKRNSLQDNKEVVREYALKKTKVDKVVFISALVLQRNISLHPFSKGIGFLAMGFIRTQIATQMVLNDLYSSLNCE